MGCCSAVYHGLSLETDWYSMALLPIHLAFMYLQYSCALYTYKFMADNTCMIYHLLFEIPQSILGIPQLGGECYDYCSG